MKRLIILTLILFVNIQTEKVSAFTLQDNRIEYTEEDRIIFERYVQAMNGKKQLALGELIIETARFFMETPYVAATLEREPEHLVVNLRELDCTTLVENVIALVRTIKGTTPSFEMFCTQLQQIRYREHVINNYTDRLHYLTDWIYENSLKNLVRDETKAIGGQPYRLNLNFMSTHPDSYMQLKSNPRDRKSTRLNSSHT